MVQGPEHLGSRGSAAEADGVLALGDQLGRCRRNAGLGGLIASVPQPYRKFTTALDRAGTTVGAIQ